MAVRVVGADVLGRLDGAAAVSPAHARGACLRVIVRGGCRCAAPVCLPCVYNVIGDCAYKLWRVIRGEGPGSGSDWKGRRGRGRRWAGQLGTVSNQRTVELPL
eukprot:scaffold12001_cov116-Isochrysis_galbana.AAC.8